MKKHLFFIRSLDYFGYTIKLHLGTFLDKDEDGNSSHKTSKKYFHSRLAMFDMVKLRAEA